MAGYTVGLLLAVLVAVSALPTDPVLRKVDDLRFQYVPDGNGNLHMADMWLKASDLERIARYNPDQQNNYHLFTRQNPSTSQPLVMGLTSSVSNSNFDPRKKTVVQIHGWTDLATGPFNTMCLQAYLATEDVNVIIVDWDAGSGNPNYLTAVVNTATSGASAARFINWLNSVTGASAGNYHIYGHSLGGHQSGIVARQIQGTVAYVTALDPALPGWITNAERFRADDGAYTEVIHTNSGAAGYMSALGQVDFYPNGGVGMPGCSGHDCDHSMVNYYFAESLRSGGFTGTWCSSLSNALSGSCSSSTRLQMGGRNAKNGASGIYHLTTNARAPFSTG